MGVPLALALAHYDAALRALFRADARVRSVGIVRHGRAYGYRAVRNAAQTLRERLRRPPRSVAGVPVSYTDAPRDVEPLLRAVAAGPASPAETSTIPEVQAHRPLVVGVQVQNYDADVRAGRTGSGLFTIGSLGAFVRCADGSIGIVSNGHVLGGENNGRPGHDRIFQPGSATDDPAQLIAVLQAFTPLRPSPPGASPADGTAELNRVDAAVARLAEGVPFTPGYLPLRRLPAPTAIAPPQLGERVFKVGRTTGLTYGVITEISTTVEVRYDFGRRWFSGSIVIEGEDGALFSDRGDSGALLVRVPIRGQADGTAVGMLYAGNGQQSYACPLDAAFAGLGCVLLIPDGAVGAHGHAHLHRAGDYAHSSGSYAGSSRRSGRFSRKPSAKSAWSSSCSSRVPS